MMSCKNGTTGTDGILPQLVTQGWDTSTVTRFYDTKNAAVTCVMAAFSCLQEAISDAWLHVS